MDMLHPSNQEMSSMSLRAKSMVLPSLFCDLLMLSHALDFITKFSKKSASFIHKIMYKLINTHTISIIIYVQEHVLELSNGIL